MSQKKISYCSIAGPCQDLTSHLVTDEYIYLSPSYLAFRYYQMYPMQTYPMYRMYQMQTDCSLPQRFLLKGRCHGSCHRSKDSVEHRFLQKTVRHPNEYFCFWIFNKISCDLGSRQLGENHPCDHAFL